MALMPAGSTTHYAISYDASLSQADGPDRAKQLLAVCEQDYDLMATWFPGLSLPYSLPVAVNIIPGGYAAASWGPPISLRPGNGSDIAVVRYLLVAEVVEMFMLAQNKGWFAADGSNEGSEGEGLSRYLSTEFLVLSLRSHSGANTRKRECSAWQTFLVEGAGAEDHTSLSMTKESGSLVLLRSPETIRAHGIAPRSESKWLETTIRSRLTTAFVTIPSRRSLF